MVINECMKKVQNVSNTAHAQEVFGCFYKISKIESREFCMQK